MNAGGLTTSGFTLGNEACKLKSKNKILCLIADNACTFKDHTELVVARCKNKWRELRIHCTSRYGLSRKTLTTLYKTLILPIMLLFAPVWSNQNAAKLQTFRAFVNRSVYSKPGLIKTRVLLKSYWAPHLSILFAKIYPLSSSPKYYSRETFYQSYLKK